MKSVQVSGDKEGGWIVELHDLVDNYRCFSLFADTAEKAEEKAKEMWMAEFAPEEVTKEPPKKKAK